MMKKINYVKFSLILFAITPNLSWAVTTPTSFKDLIGIAVNLLASVLPVIVLLALIYFLWGLTKYIRTAGQGTDEAKQVMLNGIIGFFVISTVWGLVGILSGTIGETPQKPNLGEADLYVGQGGTNSGWIGVDLQGYQIDLKSELQAKDFEIPAYSNSSSNSSSGEGETTLTEIDSGGSSGGTTGFGFFSWMSSLFD